MQKWSKVKNDSTKEVEVGLGTNEAFYKSIGYSLNDVEQAYNGHWYLLGYAPNQSVEEQNEAVRQTRESLYRATSDYIKADYDEAVARGASNAEQLKQEWLASKDKIRAENPYIDIVD